MRDLKDRVVALAMAAVLGYFCVAVVCMGAVLFIAGAAYFLGASSFGIGLGPVPLMTYVHTSTGWGFSSEWGIGALSPIGAVVGLVIAIRRETPADRSLAR